MTSKLQTLAGTTLKFNGEVGADVALSMEGLASGAARVSAQYDQGPSPRDIEWEWSIEIPWQATPTQYKSLKLYLAEAPESDSTAIDGDVGATDAALGDIDQLRNVRIIGSVTVEDANTTVMRSSGRFIAKKRYFSVITLNDGGSALNATDSNCVLLMTPHVTQAQDT